MISLNIRMYIASKLFSRKLDTSYFEITTKHAGSNQRLGYLCLNGFFTISIKVDKMLSSLLKRALKTFFINLQLEKNKLTFRASVKVVICVKYKNLNKIIKN